MIILNKQFAERVSNLRHEKKLSQKEFGELLGVSNKAVSKWENGEAMPQMKTIVKMAELFEINPSELLTGTKYDTASSTETDRENMQKLENENKQLIMQLNGAKKNKRNIVVLFICICTACAVIAALLFLSQPGSRDGKNSTIGFIGSENSYAEFGGEIFRPANSIEQTVYTAQSNSEKKYAVIYDENKNGREAVIYCSRNEYFITVPKGGRDYIYVCSKGRINVDRQTVDSIQLFKSRELTEAEKKIQNGEYKNLTECLLYEYFNYDSYFLELDAQEKFLQLYSEKNKPENAKSITKQYLTDDSLVAVAEIKGTYYKLGILFEDSEGFQYLYCFENAETYSFGKELKNLD